MSQSRGLWLAIFGVLLFALSALSLLILPGLIAVVGMLVGGMCVWCGFLWTLFGYYLPSR